MHVSRHHLAIPNTWDRTTSKLTNKQKRAKKPAKHRPQFSKKTRN